jgi:hypothetical protein
VTDGRLEGIADLHVTDGKGATGYRLFLSWSQLQSMAKGD